MAWQVLIVNVSGGPPAPDDEPLEEDFEPLCDASDYRRRVSETFPDTDWSDPECGHFVGKDQSFSIAFNVLNEGKLQSSMMDIRGGSDAISAITRFAKTNGWSLFDCSGDWLELDQPSQEGWGGYDRLRSAHAAPENKPASE